MRAAVVTSFEQPLEVREVPLPRPGRARCSCGSRRRACATPTSTPRAATGRSSRSCRSSPVTRASASSKSSARCHRAFAIGDRVAVPWLGWACGTCEHCVTRPRDPVPAAAQHRLLRRRRLRRVRRRRRPPTSCPCRTVSTRSTPPRSPAPASRPTRPSRSRGARSVRPRRDLRHRRARPPGRAVRPDRRRRRSSRSTSTTKAGPRPRARCRRTSSTPPRTTRSRRSRPWAAPTSPSPRGAPASFEQAYGSLRRGGRLVCVALPEDNTHGAADLRDGPAGHHGDRLDRRHPQRSRRDVRAARRRAHPGDPRDAQARARSTRRSPTSRRVVSQRADRVHALRERRWWR